MTNYLASLDKLEFRFQNLCGLILLVEGYEFSEQAVKSSLDFCGNDIGKTELTYNRFFVYRDYLDIYYPGERVSDKVLVEISQAYRFMLEEALASRYPDRRFVIEVVGEHLADEEPFEVCVTFKSST